MLTETLNASDLVHGDASLSTTGEKQIRFKLKTKATDFLSVLPDVVYCSPLRRALRTALVAYPSERIKVDPRLREIDANAGMMKTELENFVAATCPNRKAKVEISRVPAEKPWWNTTLSEDPEEATGRIQRVLKDVHKYTTKGKKVAIVAHGGVFRSMIEMKPFPKQWGSPRGFPRNFTPYYGTFCSTSSAFKVIPAAKEDAVLVLVRHAHSRAQAANTLAKKIQKFRKVKDPTAEAAKALDLKIRRFNSAV